MSKSAWYDIYYNNPNLPVDKIFIDKLNEVKIKNEINNEDYIENKLEQIEIDYKTKLITLENNSQNPEILIDLKKKKN